LATVQLAKSIGMKVIGTAGTAEGLKIVKETGADYVFNHREQNYMEKIKALNPEGLDLVVEMLANVNLDNDLQILRWKKGRVVVVGNRGTIDVGNFYFYIFLNYSSHLKIAFYLTKINPRLLMAKETSVCGVTLFTADEVISTLSYLIYIFFFILI
jgi:NADPH2:quinone reductase